MSSRREDAVGKRGRPALGARHVERLDGEDESKQRLQVILRALAGELTVEQACDELGISAAQFHRLREQALAGALAALAPKPPGRPGRPPPEPSRIQELEAEVLELKIDLRASQLREEIAVLMPHLLKPEPEPAPASKKKGKPARRRRRRRHNK
jgi:hypothetical protein